MTDARQSRIPDRLRYSRQLSLPQVGIEGQARLAAARVLLVGAGGLGNAAGVYLAGAGVGQLVINDFDTVDRSNLPRQILFREPDTGQPKATVLAARLQEVNPDLQVDPLDTRLTRTDLEAQVRAADVVLDCTDNFASRWLLSEICLRAATPLVTGAAIRFEGQLSVFRYDRQASPCYRCLYSEDDENLDDCSGQGILASVAGTIGCLQATETLKILLGMESDLAGKLWLYDGGSGASRLVTITTQHDCPICSAAAAQSAVTD